MAVQDTDIPGSGYSNASIDALVWGCRWTGGPITYWFGEGTYQNDRWVGNFTAKSWTDDEKAAFQRAMTSYEEVCNVKFAPAASEAEANIVWRLASNDAQWPSGGFIGIHEVPDETHPQLLGTFRYDSYEWSKGLSPGSDGYWLVLHELGHGLGLAHPHDGGNEADATIDWWMDSKYFTVMSYDRGYYKAMSASPMDLDIAALQAIYGANMETRKYDDVYRLPQKGEAEFLKYTCIWDAGGTDTITNEGSDTESYINLGSSELYMPLVAQLGDASVSAPWAREPVYYWGFTIASGVTIENAIGGNRSDELHGNGVGNRLNGGRAGDRMSGYAGDDTFVVDDSLDRVYESANEGADTVESSIGYVLGDNVEHLILTGDQAIDGTGNALDNRITGTSAANHLDGREGRDTLVGGGGDDTYEVDGYSDTVIEYAGGGIDRINSTGSFIMDNHVEHLTLLGTAYLAYGNDLANALTGNAQANYLDGGGGDDTLDGGAGADIMAGGAGDDAYRVDHTGDVVQEEVGKGFDLVFSTVSHVLRDNVENLWLQGSDNIDGTGNGLVNWVLGNAGRNRLDGGAGGDVMTGFGGDDTYVVDNLGDAVTEEANGGLDAVYASVSYKLTSHVESLTLTGPASINATGNGERNSLFGNSGNNRLDGGLGKDSLSGDAGADTFCFGAGGSVVGLERDVVWDFKGSAGDRIDFMFDANTQLAGTQDFTYRAGGVFTGVAGQLILVGNVLSGDTNGDRVADVEIMLYGVTSFQQNWLV
ncbi:matrixin family metalloprotease [Ramlibacter sp.]|uniref:matrixin family metalloprotease n=1 Tax=Ramlibacter sp. TaxID=1917967 RepID=UPI003D141327